MWEEPKYNLLASLWHTNPSKIPPKISSNPKSKKCKKEKKNNKNRIQGKDCNNHYIGKKGARLEECIRELIHELNKQKKKLAVKKYHEKSLNT